MSSISTFADQSEVQYLPVSYCLFPPKSIDSSRVRKHHIQAWKCLQHTNMSVYLALRSDYIHSHEIGWQGLNYVPLVNAMNDIVLNYVPRSLPFHFRIYATPRIEEVFNFLPFSVCLPSQLLQFLGLAGSWSTCTFSVATLPVTTHPSSVFWSTGNCCRVQFDVQRGFQQLRLGDRSEPTAMRIFPGIGQLMGSKS